MLNIKANLQLLQLFSALYKMLPSSQSYLELGGYSSNKAAWILIASFLAGVWGIQSLSRICHHFMPSQVVDCDHTHEENDDEQKHDHDQDDHNHGERFEDQQTSAAKRSRSNEPIPELEPLLKRPKTLDTRPSRQTTAQQMSSRGAPSPLELGTWGRPSLPTRVTMKVTEIVSGAKSSCDRDGPCHGYSNPCGAECFRNLNARGGTRASTSLSTRPTLRSASTGFKDRQNSQTAVDEETIIATSEVPRNTFGPSANSGKFSRSLSPSISSSSSIDAFDATQTSELQYTDTLPHHHHVPQNAFLSLSLQTSVAIALHKLPEGFITFATNHANPELGFSIFLALAIHNVSEGFALALPLFLATGSRIRAMIYSFVLGGLSQPLGAGIAALWLNIAERGRGDWAPGEAVYGGMFAATAGIMASVALNLLQQSFELSHSKGLCMFFVFVGMGIFGISSALTA